jgi:hypothetical protein
VGPAVELGQRQRQAMHQVPQKFSSQTLPRISFAASVFAGSLNRWS